MPHFKIASSIETCQTEGDPSRQYNQRFSQRSDLAKHKNAVHEGGGYHSSQYNQQSQMGGLVGHQEGVHEGVKYPSNQ